MVATPDPDRRRPTPTEALLDAITAHAEFARLESPGLEAVHTHIQKILDAAVRLREQLGPAPPAPPEPPRARASSRQERVLLVEDDQQVRQLMTRTLLRLGFDVTAAENGREALDQYEECERGPDILVTDVIMPQLGGRELAVRLRLRDPSLKILFVSGYSHGALDARVLRRPGTAFLQKPFTPRELDRALSDLRSLPSIRRA